MRQAWSLLWKEYREQRWFLLAALAIFCGFPLIEATGRYFRPPVAQVGFPAPKPEFYSDSAGAMVLSMGALLAIFVAIGSTTRDLRDELHVFWRSRPIGIGAWLGVKYLAGLVTVLTACTIPVLMQFWMMIQSEWRQHHVGVVAGTIAIHSFTLVLVFSIAFLLGCLIRHATHAALLALAAALVIYFLPVVVEPLAPLSVFNLMNAEAVTMTRNFGPRPPNGWSIRIPIGTSIWRVVLDKHAWSTFAIPTMAASIAAAAAALVAVRRDWRVAADRQAMHWSLGGVAVVLFGATAFQVGSNLKVQRQFDLPVPNHTVAAFAFDGRRGVAMLRDTAKVQYYGQTAVKICSVEVTADGAVRYGPVLTPTDTINVPYVWSGPLLFRQPQRPDRVHVLVEHSGWLPQVVNGRNFEVTLLQLITLDLSRGSGDPVIHRLDLLPHLPEMHASPRAYQGGNRVYFGGRESVLEIDLGDGDAPRVARSIDVTAPGPGRAGRINTLWMYSGMTTTLPSGNAGVQVPLAPISGLSPRQRLEATLAMAMYNVRQAIAGDLLIAADGKTLSTYRLTTLDEQTATFELLGRREQTPLERLLGSYTSALSVIDQRVYAQESRLGTGMSVYDIHDPARPRASGHFALAKWAGMHLARLANGELLLAGDRMYVLAPPKRLE